MSSTSDEKTKVKNETLFGFGFVCVCVGVDVGVCVCFLIFPLENGGPHKNWRAPQKRFATTHVLVSVGVCKRL